MNDFEDRLKKISEFLYEFSADEIANALFVSSVYPLNVASQTQHQLLLTIFSSIKPELFRNSKKIESYKDFREFLDFIYPLLPEFPIIEDYIPNADWGEIKYHYEEIDYKIFYGTELDSTYDLLQLFEIVYTSFDNEFRKISSRSPKEEFRLSLVLQNAILTSIQIQISDKELQKNSRGNKQIPSESFWQEASKAYANFNPLEVLSSDFVENYSSDMGVVSEGLSSYEKFQELAQESKNIPYFFLKLKDIYLLLLPRRISEVLIDTWSNIFREHKDIIHKNSKKYLSRLNIEIYKYIRQRLPSDNIFGLVNAITKQNKPHGIIFSSSFISRNRLVLIYVAEPFIESEEISKYLESMSRLLIRAVKLISYPPVRLRDNIEEKIIEFRSDKKAEKLKPLLFVVIPQVSIQLFGFSIPKSFQGEIISLDGLLALIDELNSIDEFVSFFEYKQSIKEKILPSMISLIDIYGSFRDSHGVLIEGARSPDMISLDPHWGSELRFESLKKFWSLYPNSGYLNHPRSWKLIKETNTRMRLEAKSFFGSAIYKEIGNAKLFFSALFEDLSYEQALITNLLIECVEDSFTRLNQFINSHPFFEQHNILHIVFFPSGLLQNDKYKFISHLKPDNKFWTFERGFPKENQLGIRVVFDENALLTAFDTVEDNSLEIDLTLAIIKEINNFAPDNILETIVKEVESKRGTLPRFKLFNIERGVSFPEHARVLKTTIRDQKMARKRVAELASLHNINTGNYKLEEAKDTLNKLRKLVVQEINSHVLRHNLVTSIPFLIERVDSLEHDHEFKKSSLKLSLQHEVEFEREQVYSNEHKEFIQNHKSIRYLIEKFIQLQPKGGDPLTIDNYLFLISLIEILHEIYMASDNIHYQIYPVGIHIGDDYLINVEYEVNLQKMSEEFSKEQAKISLGLISNEKDRIESKNIKEDIEELDIAFINSFGFSLGNLVNVLNILSVWTGYHHTDNEKSSYSSDLETIVNICVKNILNINREQVIAILEFLTLKSEDVLRILNQEELSDDLPVWEYRKRYSRYTIRPLIYLNQKYFWGAYSARRSGIIWTNVFSEKSLPVDLYSTEIEGVLENQKRSFEKSLEEKALLITKRHTLFAESNVELHKRDSDNHPSELGDYDVLAYLAKPNIILNIECKEILRAYCAKDTKRVRDKIFGRAEKEKGYLERVEDREKYLKSNWVKVNEVMKWKIPLDNPPSVVSLFVSRDMYWWTMFPIRDTDVTFLRIDLLSQYLETLSNKS